MPRRLAILGVVIFALATREARAGDMPRELKLYFDGEKNEGVTFTGAGLLALLTGAVFCFPSDDVLRGAAIPLLSIGTIELISGIVVHTRTDAQVARLQAQLAKEPRAMREGELRRMRGVELEFQILAVTESIFAAGGVATAVYGFGKNVDLAKGIGIGLAAQSMVMLTLDLLAAQRADRYVGALERFRIGVGPTGVAVLGRF